MDIYNIFNEEQDGIVQKFSTVIVFVFIYYALSYYFILSNPITKPHVAYMLMMIIIHIIHIILLKFFHSREEFSYMWIVAILPLVLYLCFSKYKMYNKKKEEEKKKEMYATLQKQNEVDPNFMRNARPQSGGAPPMGGTQYVGLQRNEDGLSNHQKQHNTPLPPQNAPISETQLPQIAHQESMKNTQYDEASPNNYRINNTVMEPTQKMARLDMLAIGGNAGSAMGAYDAHGSNFGVF